ncbi:DUF4293 domain-containing protein [Lutimonas sp.]|uniref:DUF4293 domain-containing protein n=1 Tax=Lutimonas sp. TaxID=1872403 RepID=UPI003D9BEA95
MIQRIQSIYLIIAMLLSWLVAFLVPFWVDQNSDVIYLNSLFQDTSILNLVVPILFIGSGLVSFLSFLAYKNRTRQIISNRLNIVINFFLLGIIVYHLLNLPGETIVSEKGIGVFIPLLVIVFLVLSNKAIIKDEKLVKSVDRLR